MENIKEELLEDLADMVHQQWMKWTKGLCEDDACITDERRERWESYWVDYKDLPEETKEIDRKIALEYIKVINKHCLCL